MNKNQVLIVSLVGIVLACWSLWGLSIIIGNSGNAEVLIKKIPLILKVNIFLIIPVLIIGFILFYTLRNRDI